MKVVIKKIPTKNRPPGTPIYIQINQNYRHYQQIRRQCTGEEQITPLYLMQGLSGPHYNEAVAIFYS